MKCFSPLRAWQRGAAKPVFTCPVSNGYRVLELPCGQCVGCRLAHAREWAVRCVHESKLHAENCFATFTYSPEVLPADLSLNHRHFQLFMKRFREQVTPVRYYMCGEYGDKGSRPHYHACMFGWYPKDRVFYRTSEAGFKVYTSELLDSVWQLGKCYVGDLSFESAGYVARYVLKKVGFTGKREILDVTTGEIVLREHEYSRMSLKPGIGADWFKRYRSDVFPRDKCIIRGVPVQVPKYYDKLLAVADAEYAATVKAARIEAADVESRRLAAVSDNPFGDVRRLKIHEQVKLASIRSLRRR